MRHFGILCSQVAGAGLPEWGIARDSLTQPDEVMNSLSPPLVLKPLTSISRLPEEITSTTLPTSLKEQPLFALSESKIPY